MYITVYEEAVQIARKLSLAEKVHLLEYLGTALKDDLEVEGYKHIEWEQFLDLTYGSLADEPIERNQPAYFDVRDEIE